MFCHQLCSATELWYMSSSNTCRNLFIDLLTYKRNTYQFNIPENIQEYLDSILEKIDKIDSYDYVYFIFIDFEIFAIKSSC
jgi:hypothetical protein